LSESGHTVVNDFSIQVATVNGSGSQTANTVLMRSIFQMGVPVSGKNMFPSNIAGLPTWFTIRASKHGYIGRKKEIDLLVAMNPETAREDVMKLDSGAAVVYDEPLKLNALRSDLHFYPAPFDKLVAPVCPDAKLRKLVRNMLYDGIVAWLLSIEMDEIHNALVKQFGKRKAKAAELNWGAAQAGYEYAAKTYTKTDQYRVQRMHANTGKIIVEGNAACALGAMFAGVTVVTWYPITPSSSLVETLIGYLKRFRIDKETGRATFAVVQAEDELASIGMALGAGWAGARSMTATAGPGISLMSEFVGHLRCAARRSFHRAPHSHHARRSAFHRAALARRYPAPHVLPLLSRRMFHYVGRGLRFRRELSDSGVRDDRSRPGHEQLDVRPLPVSREAARPRQGAHRRRSGPAGRLCAL
jgi:2-oxoglutarate ferredoxin oxidoreductase subunit alpha